MSCPVCGHTEVNVHSVIWDTLASEWELTKEQRSYLDVQQGGHCGKCGVKVRCAAIHKALMRYLNGNTNLKALEINSLATYSPKEFFSVYDEVIYPQIDMTAMPYPDESYDVVLHSDTLEHIPDPIKGLQECQRVLKKGGALIFTVPLLVERMTRNRDGLSKSLHGSPSAGDDFLVCNEFGADVWRYLVVAGFDDIRITTFLYPAGIAFTAIKTG